MGGYYAAQNDRVSDFSQADGDRIDVSKLGISEFATLQQLLSDGGADTLLTFFDDGFAQTTRIVGLADFTTLTEADFVFSAATTNNTINGSYSGDDLFGGLGDDVIDRQFRQ